MKRVVHILFLLLVLTPFAIQAQLRLEGIKREALKHIQNGRYGDAIDQLNKYIAADPRNPEGYYLRGLCREKRQEYAYGREDYRKALKLDNGYTEAREALERLKRTWYENLYDKIEGLKRDIAVNPKNPYPYLEIGRAYQWLEEWEKAEEWYDKYLAMDKNASPDEIIRYSIILTETHHIYKGWLKLKEYTERFPEDWRLWSRFGWFSNWLGKYKIAEKAFLNALNIKPYFKEAQDGLDVARREAYVTIYSEDYNGNGRRAKEYPIDRYYRILHNNPDDDEKRFNLVELLIQHDRYEEAHQQLKILAEKHSEEERYKNLWETVESYRKRFFEEKITEALSVLSDEPYNKEATLKLAQYFRSLSAYHEAEELLKKYLLKFDNDDEARYLYAKILSEDGQFQQALVQADTLMELAPDNLDYQLLTAQLNIWGNKDLDKAEKLLKNVLENRPNDQIALIAAGTLNFQLDNFDLAEEFARRAEEIDPKNPDLLELKTMLELERIRQEENKYIESLNKGREIAKNGDCESALPLYEEYLDKFGDDYQVQVEYASILVCANHFSEAIDVYDQLLDEEYDVDLDKMRAKIIYWSGDSLRAYEELQRLVKENPDDLELKLYLGDVNVKLKNYEAAKDIYLALKEIAPESYLINQRLEWLPYEYQETTTLGRIFNGITKYAFSYMNFNPLTSYFNDNLGFEYYYYGTQLAVGFTRFVSLGATFYQGRVNNTSLSLGGMPFNVIKGNIFISPMENLSVSFGIGQVNSTGIMTQPLYEGVITYKPINNLNTSIRYEHNDGVFQLLSNELINRRIPSNTLRFDASYKYKTGLVIKSYYSLIWTDKNNFEIENIGNYFQIRLGKYFTNNTGFGYEYHFEDFKYNSPYYYTPEIFDSHSIWGEWRVYEDKIWNFAIGGKVGYVPISNYIVRELNTEISYTILKNLRLLATGFLSSSIREITAYSSGSFYMNIFWSIY